MKYIFNLFVFILLFVQTVIGQDVVSIDPERTSRGTLTLSDIIESIEYIPLETNNNCLIGDIIDNRRVLLSENYILVGCYTSGSYFLFSRTGKFIAKIGSKGQGPGEYLSVSSPFAIDEKNQQIILKSSIMGSYELMYHNMNGKYLHKVPVDRRLFNFHNISFYDKYVVMNANDPDPNPNNRSGPPFDYSIFSGDYKLITEKIKKIDFISKQSTRIILFGISFCYYLYNEQLYVKHNGLNDTIYSINKNFDFLPKYAINFGRYSFTRQIVSNTDLFMRERNNRAWLQSVFETDNYLLISYDYKKKHFYLYYDKKQHRSLLFNSDSGIPNDYDGGLNFWPKQQNGNEFITWYNSYLFEENENKLKPKGPKKAIENFEKITQEIIDFQDKNSTEANPVLVIVKLKQ